MTGHAFRLLGVGVTDTKLGNGALAQDVIVMFMLAKLGPQPLYV